MKRSRSFSLVLSLSLATIAVEAKQKEGFLEKRDRQTVEKATKDLKDARVEKRTAAAASLAGSRNPGAVPLLIQALSDVNVGVRLAAVTSLESLRKDAQPATEALAKALGDSDDRIRLAAVRALDHMEKDALPAKAGLVKLLDDPNLTVVTDAAELLERHLGMTERDLGKARLRVFEKSDDTRDRFLAARSLIRQADSVAIADAIIAYTKANLDPKDKWNNNTRIGKDALVRLVETTKDRKMINALSAAMRDFPIRNDIPMEALSKFEPKPASWRDLLIEQLSRESRREALWQLGTTVRAAADVKVWAKEAMVQEAGWDDSDRDGLVDALGAAGGAASEFIDFPLRVLANAKNAGHRESAAEAIGKIGDPRQATSAAGKKVVAEKAIDALKAAEKDAEKDVRDEATAALEILQQTGRFAQDQSYNKVLTTKASGDEALETVRSKGLGLEAGDLARALLERDIQAVTAYLDAGIDPNAENGGETPLTSAFTACAFAARSFPKTGAGGEAAAAAPVDIVKLLVARGANVNRLTGPAAIPPLTRALMSTCGPDVVRVLLKAGAKADAKDKNGGTALDIALIVPSGTDSIPDLVAGGARIPAAVLKERRGTYLQYGGVETFDRGVAAYQKAVGAAAKR